MNKIDALNYLKDLRECFRNYETIEVRPGDLTALNVAIEVMEKSSLNSMNQENNHVVTIKLDPTPFLDKINELKLSKKSL